MKKQNDHIVACHCSVDLIKFIKKQSKNTGAYIVSCFNYGEVPEKNPTTNTIQTLR